MGKHITFIGAGAVGGFAGGRIAKMGQDVTLIDSWSEHVEAIKQHGIRLTTPEASDQVPVRALHMHKVQSLIKHPQRCRFHRHQVLRHRMGHNDGQGLSGSERRRRFFAELHKRGADSANRQVGAYVGLHCAYDKCARRGCWSRCAHQKGRWRCEACFQRRRNTWSSDKKSRRAGSNHVGS